MISPVPFALNYQKRAGTIKIWQDYPYTNVFILKNKTIFNYKHPVRVIALSLFTGKIT